MSSLILEQTSDGSVFEKQTLCHGTAENNSRRLLHFAEPLRQMLRGGETSVDSKTTGHEREDTSGK